MSPPSFSGDGAGMVFTVDAAIIDDVCVCVCASVCLSQATIVSKRHLTCLNVIAHVFCHYNFPFILIFAVSAYTTLNELWALFFLRPYVCDILCTMPLKWLFTYDTRNHLFYITLSVLRRLCLWHDLCRGTATHTQPFNGPWFGTTRVGRYQKKHSPTHTHPDHRTSFIIFLLLQRSMASSLFILRAWHFSRTTSLQVLFGLPLGLGPSTSYSILH